ncbi:MAG: hypothetical protein DI604_25025 [Delftia acidovorans]|nr:MAG: hypothetical protein DI604_25025 [Delftia acidovorans]
MTTTVNANLFRIVSAFISSEETRYYLRGVFIHSHQTKGVYLVATDCHRLMVAHDETGSTDTKGVIVQLDKAALLACKPAKGDLGERLVRVSNDGRAEVLAPWGEEHKPVAMCHDSIVDGTFPDYARVAFPSVTDPSPATFNHRYVAEFGAAAASLTGNKNAGLRIIAAGENPALVRFSGVEHAYGVIMPIRHSGSDTIPYFMTMPAADQPEETLIAAE